MSLERQRKHSLLRYSLSHFDWDLAMACNFAKDHK